MWPFGRRRREIEALRTELAEVKNMASAPNVFGSDWVELFGHHFRSLAGTVVTADSAMQSSTVFACVRLIGACVSSSPCLVYKGRYGMKGERKIAWDHDRAAQLRLKPCGRLSASIFWKFIIQCKLLRGNGYAVIRPTTLVPINPDRVIVYWAWELGLNEKLDVDPFRLFYHVTWENGGFELIDQDEMLHFPNLGWDGKQGLSTIRAATQSIGLALAQEENSAKFHGQGAQYDIAMKFPGKVSEDVAERITNAYLRKRQANKDQSTIPLIIEQGGDVKELSMTRRDAQALEDRQYSAIDQCKWFGVPPVMVGETEKNSSWGSGVEQVMRWFVMGTLNDHFTDIEQELEIKLFPSGRFFAEFEEGELVRGDTKTMGEYYRIMRGNSQEPGILTVEEIRIDAGHAAKPTVGELQKPTVGDANVKPTAATE